MIENPYVLRPRLPSLPGLVAAGVRLWRCGMGEALTWELPGGGSRSLRRSPPLWVFQVERVCSSREGDWQSGRLPVDQGPSLCQPHRPFCCLLTPAWHLEPGGPHVEHRPERSNRSRRWGFSTSASARALPWALSSKRGVVSREGDG